MFAITGITGRVGGSAAETLLSQGHAVRAVVRSEDKGERFRSRGCEVAVVPDSTDTEALARAFADVAGVFLMNPPDFDPEPGFPRVQREAAATFDALARAQPGVVVLLSSVGAQVREFNLLNRSHIFEQMLVQRARPAVLLRAAWFMENVGWDVASARAGQIHSHLQPLDRAIEMVSARDVGRMAAELLVQTPREVRIVELGGPRRVSPADIADAFAKALGREVKAVAVPRAEWEAQFRADGFAHPEARMRMLDGFNEGWIDFERIGTELRRGTVELDDVVRALVAD